MRLAMLTGADIVGLDVGVSSIKAVRLRQTLSGRRSITYFRRTIPIAFPWADIDHKIRLVKEFMHANRLTGLPVITALSCSELTLRTIGFPFGDIRKVGQLVPNEVESLIPLPLEEAAVGYQFFPASQRARGEKQGVMCRALVAIAHAQMLTAHIQRMREAGFEPAAVQPDALALFSLSRHMRRHRPGFPPNLAIIDIGASKTTICLTLRGHPWLVRTICQGLTNLARSTDRPVADSDGHGEYDLIGLGSTKEPGFSALLRQLRLTLHAYQSTAETTVRQVLFCGGGVGFPALTGELSQRLELEPIYVPFLHQVRWRSAYSVALGLALSGTPSKAHLPFTRTQIGSGIDLRKALERAQPTGQKSPVSFKRLGLGFLVVVLLGLADLSTNIVLKEQYLQMLSRELRAQFHQHFPNIDVITDELEQAKAALSATHKAKEWTGGDHVAVLLRLAALVKQLPRGIKLHVTGLTIEPSAVHIEGQTDSFDSVEMMKRQLQALPDVRDITIRDVSVGSLPGQVLFRLVIAAQ